MDKEGIQYHALVAVLYAAHKSGLDLSAIVQIAKNDTAGNPGLRPPPQDLNAVLNAVEDAVNDVATTLK